jgi:hypothetical protein
MKFILLLTLSMISLSSFAEEIPCAPQENHCSNTRSFGQWVSGQSNTYYAKGNGYSYEQARDHAKEVFVEAYGDYIIDNFGDEYFRRMNHTKHDVDHLCGMNAIKVLNNKRTGLVTVWVNCTPVTPEVSSGPRRLGSMVCGAGGKGCIIIK